MKALRVDPLVQEHWDYILSRIEEIATATLLLPEFDDAQVSYIVSRITPHLFEQIYAKGFAQDGWNAETGRYKRRQVPRYLRDLVYTRDNYLCVECGRPGTPQNPLTVDHVKPVSLGGLTILENLQTMCRKDNMKKGIEYDDGMND